MAKSYGKKNRKNKKNFKLKTKIAVSNTTNSTGAILAKPSSTSNDSKANSSKVKNSQIKSMSASLSKQQNTVSVTTDNMGDGINNIAFIKKDLWLMGKSVIVVILIFIACYFYLSSSAGQKLIENIKL